MTNRLTKQDERLAELVRIGCVIPRELAARERDLVTLKWPSYRFMGPMTATRLFLSEYEAAYKRHHAKNRDLEGAKTLRIGRKISFNDNNDRLTQLWKARQEADSLSIPYSDYFDFCFDFAARRSGRRYLPQPNQLGPKGKSAKSWNDQFNTYWKSDRVYISLGRMEPMAQYALQYRINLPSQKAFIEDLLLLAKDTRTNISGFVFRYIAQLSYLRIEDVDFFDRATVQQAYKRAQDEFSNGIGEAHIYPKLQAAELLQSCFGVPGVTTDQEKTCQSCRLLQSCEKVRDRTIDRIIIKKGNADPIADRRRALSRERTRRFRARQADPREA